MKNNISLYLFSCLMFLNLTSAAQMPGDLDESFGSDGFVYLNMEADSAEYLMDVISLKNDKILLVGYILHPNSFDLQLTKLNKNGSLDLSFGNGGYRTIDLGSSDQIDGVTELSDGKILITGHTLSIQKTDGYIMRLNANGSTDSSFGEGAKGYTLFNAGSNTSCWPREVRYFNGSIYIAASTYNSEGDRDFSIFKFTQGGVLDQSFASSGSNLIDVNGQDDVLSMEIAPNGHIVLGGVSHNGIAQYGSVVKLNQFGLLDAQFRGTGTWYYKESTDLNTIIDVCFDHAGRVLAVGSEGDNPDKNGMIFRFKLNGELDSLFSNDGVQSSDIGLTQGVYLNSIAVEKDNSVLVMGYFYGTQYSDVYVLKLDSSGKPHSNFGSNGHVNHPVPLEPAYLYFKAAAIQSDGNIVIAGTTAIDGYDAYNITVCRIINIEDSLSMGLGHLEKPEIISLYPNPAQSSFTVELSSGQRINTVELHNLQGQTVQSWSGTSSYYEFDPSISPGTYFILLGFDSGIYTLRIVIR